MYFFRERCKRHSRNNLGILQLSWKPFLSVSREEFSYMSAFDSTFRVQFSTEIFTCFSSTCLIAVSKSRIFTSYLDKPLLNWASYCWSLAQLTLRVSETFYDFPPSMQYRKHDFWTQHALKSFLLYHVHYTRRGYNKRHKYKEISTTQLVGYSLLWESACFL